MKHALGTTTPTTSAARLLATVLDAPDLAAEVQALPPPVLAKIIDHVGLEDASEIIALATTEQLTRVWDEDLWRNDRPGVDEVFDTARFATWLAVLRESGDAFVAEKLAELPEDWVALALHGLVWVLAIDDLHAALEPGDDDADAIDKALASCLSEELDDLVLVSRGHDGWDDALAALLALDRDHHDVATRILERLRRMTSAAVDDSGLYDVLSEAESVAADVAADREERRDALGFVAPASAAAFLALASSAPCERGAERDPITRAYFRTARPSVSKVAVPSASRGALARLLAAAHGDTGPAPALLGADASSAAEPLLVRAMRVLGSTDPVSFAARSEELAYLTNVLIAGESFDGRRARPIEAIARAVATVDAGLALAVGEPSDDALQRATEVLRATPADVLFRMARGGRRTG